MRGPGSNRQLSRIAVLLASLLATLCASAHPEDELCLPGSDSMDPALCAALAELDRSDGIVQVIQTPPVVDASGNQRGILATASLYLTIGVRHILPGGLDHILFVLAIFLASPRWRALLLQVSAFTVAHTVTLALAATGVITPSASIVEPLIALTIGLVAFENILFKEMTRWRPAVVFGFGLIHGLGFAGFFGELGLPQGQFWSALIGFNLGVEIGQLAVLAAAVGVGLVARRLLGDEAGSRQYRRFVVLPGSALTGLVGLWWLVERLTP